MVLILSFIVCLLIISLSICCVIFNEKKKIIESKNREIAHLSNLYRIAIWWIDNKIDAKIIQDVLLDKGYSKIAIYGMGKWGMLLVDTLKGTNISVLYGIDMNARKIYCDIPVVLPNDNFENVDAFIVTTIEGFDEIRELIRKKIKKPIISIEQLAAVTSKIR